MRLNIKKWPQMVQKMTKTKTRNDTKLTKNAKTIGKNDQNLN